MINDIILLFRTVLIFKEIWRWSAMSDIMQLLKKRRHATTILHQIFAMTKNEKHVQLMVQPLPTRQNRNSGKSSD
jgi:hypothetical protein